MKIFRISAIVWMFLPSTELLAEELSGAGTAVSSAQLAQVVLGLLGVLALILLFAWLARSMLRIQPAANGHLRIRGGLSMGPREKVVLLQVGEQQLVLGVAPGRISTLHVLEEPLPDGADQNVAGSGFANLLSRYQAAGSGRGKS